jgi:hypothetical protein
MSSPKSELCAVGYRARLHQGFATCEMGFTGQFAGSSPELPMSALGQERTFSGHAPMSGLPLKADICSFGELSPSCRSCCGSQDCDGSLRAFC